MKKYLILSLTCLLLLGTSSASYTPQEQIFLINQVNNNLLTLLRNLEQSENATMVFSDVKDTDDSFDAIVFCVAQQIVSPTSTDTFSPDLPLTRGLLAAVFASAEKADLGTAPQLFQDSVNAWYHDSANWCASVGIMTGYPDGSFFGEGKVTREELAQSLYCYAQYTGYDPKSTSITGYSDYKNVANFAISALGFTMDTGVQTPIDGKLLPKENATREQVAVAIYELLKII